LTLFLLLDTNGYIGYTPSQSTIYVAFRGSESIKNWVDNLDAILTSYPLCNKCEVHKGFYSAEQDSLTNVLSVVKDLKSKYPSYSVLVTGHSLGAALATLTILDMQKAGISPLRLFNFGSPRIGNDEFAEYASGILSDHSRVTHHKDMVVHTPMHERFTHINGEFYQPGDAVELKTCSGYEDSDCSYQWHLTNIDDHLSYLGVTMGTGGCSAIL
jgi:predicted lipase